MKKQPYAGAEKVTNEQIGMQSQEQNHSITSEQISDTVAEGTIDVKLGKQSEEQQ